MKIISKRLRVIVMTAEEVKKFHELMEQAERGASVNYAEARLENGSYLGVAVQSKKQQEEEEHEARAAALQRQLHR